MRADMKGAIGPEEKEKPDQQKTLNPNRESRGWFAALTGAGWECEIGELAP